MRNVTAQGTIYLTVTPSKPATRKPRTYRKIGGIHWLAIGPYRLSFCRTRGTEPMGFELLLSAAMIIGTIATVIGSM